MSASEAAEGILMPDGLIKKKMTSAQADSSKIKWILKDIFVPMGKCLNALSLNYRVTISCMIPSWKWLLTENG